MRSFKTALSNGHRAERAWVEDLRQLGRSVAHGRKLVIRRHNKQKDHCETPDAVGLVSIEIKERSLKFTSPEDYPYETVFVDDMHGLERETIRHLAYVLRSKPTGEWVWLTPLDRGRGHIVPTLVAPRGCLRPAHTLVDFLYPHGHLEWVDADTGGFVAGGGATEEREHHPKRETEEAGGGGGAPANEGDKHVG
jgi:hypothetical protein